MYEWLLDRTVPAMARARGIPEDSEAYAKLRYGAYALFLNLAKTLVLVVLALLLGIWREVPVFMLAFATLRLFSFGAHLQAGPLFCTLASLVNYLGAPFLARAIALPLWAVLILLILCFIALLVYAPSATTRRPIPQRQVRPFKVKSLVTMAALAVATILLQVNGLYLYANLLLLGALCQCFSLLPLAYEIFRVPRDV